MEGKLIMFEGKIDIFYINSLLLLNSLHEDLTILDMNSHITFNVSQI